MRRLCAGLLLAALLALLAGCETGSRELQDLSLVVAIGVDQHPGTPKLVDVTTQIVKIGQVNIGPMGQGGSGEKAFWNLTSTGVSLFDAMRGSTQMSHNKLYSAHAQVIIFGQELAREGLANDMDFFMRDNEVRINIPVAIADTTAADVMNVESQIAKVPAENLKVILADQHLLSEGRTVVMLDLANSLLSETSAQVMPLLRVIQNNGESVVAAQGVVVLRKGRLVGELDARESRGVQWITGNVDSGIINIPTQTRVMTYEIKGATAKLQPRLVDGVPHMQVDINMECVLTSQNGTQDISNEMMPVFEKQVEDQIAGEVDAALQKAWQLGTDVFDFGEAIHHSRLMDWQTTLNHWDEIFPKIVVDVSVKSEIRGEGGLVAPVQR